MKFNHILPLSILVSLSLNACSLLKASEAENSGFFATDQNMVEKRERFPFNKVWFADWNEKEINADSIYVAPIDTSHLLALRWQDNLSIQVRKQIETDAKELAEYFKEKLLKKYREREDLNLEILETPKADSIIVELALVEVSSTKDWLNATGTVAGFFIPGAGTISGLLSGGSVAFEGRLRLEDEIIARFKDHEDNQITPIGIQNFTWYSHTHKTLDSWAEQLVELAATREQMTEVEDSSPFDLRTW